MSDKPPTTAQILQRIDTALNDTAATNRALAQLQTRLAVDRLLEDGDPEPAPPRRDRPRWAPWRLCTCGHGPGYHDGPTGTQTAPAGRCYHNNCPCTDWRPASDPQTARTYIGGDRVDNWDATRLPYRNGCIDIPRVTPSEELAQQIHNDLIIWGVSYVDTDAHRRLDPADILVTAIGGDAFNHPGNLAQRYRRLPNDDLDLDLIAYEHAEAPF